MKKASAKSVGSPKKQRTQKQAHGKNAPSLEVKERNLIINGKYELSIVEGCVYVPGDLMDSIDVRDVPEHITLNFDCYQKSRYPTNCFSYIQLTGVGNGKLNVSLLAEYSLEEWTDPISPIAWRAILVAAAKIEVDENEQSLDISDIVKGSKLIFKVTFPAKSDTIRNVIVNEAIGAILRIEARARAFHFAVAQERRVFDKWG
jgi:hypothetical protein